MRIVTAGYPYIDIDAYAGIIAYAELLNLQGIEAQAVSTAPLNESIPKIVQDWVSSLITDYSASDDDDFVLIDLSDPDFFEKFVNLEQVEGVIDHHVGFEEYWKNRIGKKAEIEFIGAACTIVYEQWIAAGLLEKMSQTSARLLVCGILDNTLNFGAKVTTERDSKAYEELKKIARLPDDWAKTYFIECEKAITTNLKNALEKDIKHVKFKSYDKNITFGQILVWNAAEFIEKHGGQIEKFMKQFIDGWFVNVIGLKDAQSAFYSTHNETKKHLEPLLKIEFKGKTGFSSRLWLRKEVIKEDHLSSGA